MKDSRHRPYTRPFLKWAGNKYTCLSTVLNAFPKANRLIEPFAGSCCIFLNANYPQNLIAEQNLDLIALYQHLKEEGEAFIAYCEAYFCETNNQSELYYHLREAFNHCTDSKQRAALFLYLNRHGYNGLCRYNQSGKFNVPFGAYILPFFPKERMRFFYQKAQSATFVHQDFRKTFQQAVPGDLIYCDPPYAPIKQLSNFSAYTQGKFGEEEQIALAKLACEARDRGITVIISNHDTEFTRQLYQSSTITSFKVRRFISRNADERHPAQELLAIFS